MSWIDEIEPEDADRELQEAYKMIREDRGKLSNIMKVHSLMPEAMESHMDLYMSVMFESRSISRKICELIGVVVSNENGCDYCVNHHAEALNHYWRDEERLEDLKRSYKETELTDREERVAEYAVQLTEDPSKVSEEDIEDLREVGFADEQILNINLIASYFNFVNRIALGLGVEFSQEEVEGYEY